MALFIGVLTPSWAQAQGSFMLSNMRLGEEAKVRECMGEAVGGEHYVMQVLVRNPATGKWSPNLTVVRAGKEVRLGNVAIREGRMAGVFSEGVVTVPFLDAGQTADLVFRVWDARTGKDYDSAKSRGETRLSIRLGGGKPENGVPPPFPAMLDGFKGVRVCAVNGRK